MQLNKIIKQREIIINKLKLLSLFSGIGAFEKALSRVKIPYELISFSEIDKYAIKSYCAIHNVNEDKNLGDISKVVPNDILDFDLLTYGFPCQDISVAGRQEGINENTRSGLLHYAEEIIKTTKPKFAIAENVKNLVGKGHIDDFENLLNRLDMYGYNNYWRIINSIDFNIPQDRERVFLISIRKDLDSNAFAFPENKPLTKTIFDILEPNVEDKYYKTNVFKRYSKYADIDFPKETLLKLINNKERVVYRTDSMSYTITASGRNAGHNLYMPSIGRVFTPKECWRLQGFDDENIDKCIEVGISNTQLYKQAGNSITVNVLEEIFKNLLNDYIIA